MGFDATKLVVGKSYLRRDGGAAKFLGTINNQSFPLAFVFEGGIEFVNMVTGTGLYVEPSSRFDIISDEPIKEPVEVTLPPRFVNVWERQDGTRYYATYSFKDKEECDDQKDHVGHKRVGIYEMPSTILVTPK